MRRLLGNILTSQVDFEVAFARDGVEALAKVHDFRPDVVTLDINMPNMDGLACLDRIMLERPTRVVMVSSLTTAGADETLEAMSLGAIDFVAKPHGALSLSINEIKAALIDKVRSVSKARLRNSHRLAERVRLRGAGIAAREHAPSKRPTEQSTGGKSLAAGKTAAGGDGIVVVGTSTGGPPALDALLAPLPADFRWPILVAQHMPASFTGPLARRLDRLCALSVREVTHAVPLESGNVYVGKGDADIVVLARGEDLFVASVSPSEEHRWHPSVDRLVITAMEHVGAERIVGVLMTGMGADGAVAMARLHSEGGRTIAEAQETAVFWGMPGELVKLGGAGIVTPLEKIATHLIDWLR
jgi:two-component system chemotaxis response regulator CheB